LTSTSSILDALSIMEDDGLNQRIGHRIRDLRSAASLSLEALATRCGVSRSMISLIERGEASPTAVVLERLATGLDVALASLFDPPEPASGPVSRRADQPVWRDSASGYLRRNVSPAGGGSPIQIVEVLFPPGARVAYETGPRAFVVHHQVWVLDGVVDVTVGVDRHHLETGDCLAFVLDRPVVYENPTTAETRYAVTLVTDHRGGRPRRTRT
jgi:transcriptional regulator with XRE-family HTH domain